jgi:FkbM family methyltransferase
MFIKINKKTFKVKKNNLFWGKFLKNKWEPLNLKIYKSLIEKNTNYYDVGSWIGPTVLTAANFFPKEIYAFEPDSKAYEELKNNIFLNKKKLNKIKIELYNKAAYLSNGKIILNIPYGNLGASTSSLIKSANASYESLVIKSLNFLSFMKKKKLKSEDFIKIDIEGGEYKLLPFIGSILRKRKPNIYLAPHPFLIDGYFNKIVMTNKLLFSLRGYKYIYQIKKNNLTSCRMINFLLKYRLPIFKKISRTLVFTNKKLLN